MAGEKLGYVYSAFAGADHSELKNVGVVISGAKDGLPVVSLPGEAGAGKAINGVLVRGDVKDTVERVSKDGVCWMEAGAAIAAVGEVEIDAAGCIITKNLGTAIGYVLATAADGDVVPVFVY